MSYTFTGSKAEIVGTRAQDIEVTLEDVDLADVLQQVSDNNTTEEIISDLTVIERLTDIVLALDQEEVINEIVSNGIGVKGIVDQVEVGPILDEIGADICKEHFELVDKE